MEKEFVPYELALKMKELGFDEPCFGYYNHYIKGVPLNMCGSDYNGTGQPAPTWQSAFRWFREKYDLHISIVYYQSGYSINDLRRFKTYEEAEVVCLTELIEIVENGKTL